MHQGPVVDRHVDGSHGTHLAHDIVHRRPAIGETAAHQLSHLGVAARRGEGLELEGAPVALGCGEHLAGRPQQHPHRRVVGVSGLAGQSVGDGRACPGGYHLCEDLVQVGEVTGDRAGAHPCGGRHVANADPGQPALVEQGAGGIEDAAAGPVRRGRHGGHASGFESTKGVVSAGVTRVGTARTALWGGTNHANLRCGSAVGAVR